MAIEQLDSLPDVVILDLMLPDGEGEQVLREIRMRNLPIRVVIATGVADSDRLAALRELEPHAILNKPIPTNQLMEAIGVTGDDA